MTTPNVASLTSVGAALNGWKNAQIFSKYPAHNNRDTPHVREYTTRELSDAVRAARFCPQSLFTEPIAGFGSPSWVRDLLQEHGFDITMRGEQIYCLARKRGRADVRRFPACNWAPFAFFGPLSGRDVGPSWLTKGAKATTLRGRRSEVLHGAERERLYATFQVWPTFGRIASNRSVNSTQSRSIMRRNPIPARAKAPA